MDRPEGMHHDVPFRAVGRLLVIGFGLAAIGLATSFSSSVFGGQSGNPTLSLIAWLAIIAFGVWQVARGLFTPAQRWLVTPGHIEIASRGPFRENVQVIPAGDIGELSLYEDQDIESSTTRWGVTIVTIDGRRFRGNDFVSKDEAQQLLARIESALQR